MALTEEQILESIIPEVEISGVLIETYGSSGVRFVVDYVVYDVVGGDEISRFFATPEFEKYLRFRVNYSLNSSFGADAYNRNARSSIALKDIYTENNMFRTSQLDNGSLLKEFKFQETYTFEKHPEYFEIYAMSFVDTDAIEEDMSLDPGTFVLPVSATVKSEQLCVIDKGKVKSKRIRYCYYEDTDELQNNKKEWRGDVHPVYDPNDFRKIISYMTGKRRTEDSIEVTREEENFTKTQDFRERKKLAQAREYDSNQVMFSKMSNIERDSIKRFQETATQTQASSDMWLSRSISGNARFLMAIDIKNLLLANSKYNYYHANLSQDVLNKLASNVEIVSIDVYRERVKKIHTGSGRVYVDEFRDDTYEKEHIVSTSRLPNSQSVRTVETSTGSIRQIELSQEPELLFLTGTDYNMSGITDGTYSYGYSIKILDPTRAYLKERVMELYPYLHTLESVARQIENDVKSYDVQKNTYNQGYREEFVIDFADAEYSNLLSYEVFHGKVTTLTEFVVEAIYKYQEIHRIFKNRDFQSSRHGYNLLAAGLKANLTPRGINLLMDIYKSLINKLSEIVDLKIENKSAHEPVAINKSSRDEIVAENFTRKIAWLWDSNVPKGSGISYLEDPLTEFSELQRLQNDTGEIGLRTIPGARWEVRTQSETARFFQNPQTNITLPLTEDRTAVNSISLTSEGSEVFSPSVFFQESTPLINTVGSPVAAETIVSRMLPVTDSYAPQQLAPPSPPPPAPINGQNAGGLPSTRWRSMVARNIFAPFNVTFDNAADLSTLQDRARLSDELISAIDGCTLVTVSGRAIDPYDGWDEEKYEEELRLEPPSSTNQQTESATDNISDTRGTERRFDIGMHMLSKFRIPLMSTLNNFTPGVPTPPHEPTINLTSSRNINSNLDISEENRANSAISLVPLADRQSFVQSLPNQIKSLMLSSVSNNPRIQDYSIGGENTRLDITPSYQVNAGFLASIEYFTGFQRYNIRTGLNETEIMDGDVNFGASSAKWKKLTVDEYGRNKGKLLLCRIKRNHLSDLGIQENDFGVPIYDSYFLIQPPVEYREEADTSNVGVDAARRARRQQEAESRARRLHRETELEKARIIRHIERCQREIDLLNQDNERLQEEISQNETVIGVIRSGSMNYQEDWGWLAQDNYVSDVTLRERMLPEPYRRYTSLLAFNEACRERIAANNAEKDRCEDLIAGYSRAISRATYVDIDTADEIRHEYEKNRQDVQQLEAQISARSTDIRVVEDNIGRLHMEERKCHLWRYDGDDPIMAIEYNRLKRGWQPEADRLRNIVVTLRNEIHELQREIREYEREANEGTYVDDRPLEDF